MLRDEGEAYARKLIEAGVPTTSVRYNATIHDFMMLNPLRGPRPRPRRHRAGRSTSCARHSRVEPEHPHPPDTTKENSP